MINLIAAVAESNVIGDKGRIPWKLPMDQQYFKQLTLGHTVIMGRKTYETLTNELIGRNLIVLSRDNNFKTKSKDTLLAHSIREALNLANGDSEIFIAGGQEIYQQFMELADTIYLTQINLTVTGDSFFPEISDKNWTLQSTSPIQKHEKSQLTFGTKIYKKINS